MPSFAGGGAGRFRRKGGHSPKQKLGHHHSSLHSALGTRSLPTSHLSRLRGLNGRPGLTLDFFQRSKSTIAPQLRRGKSTPDNKKLRVTGRRPVVAGLGFLLALSPPVSAPRVFFQLLVARRTPRQPAGRARSQEPGARSGMARAPERGGRVRGEKTARRKRRGGGFPVVRGVWAWRVVKGSRLHQKSFLGPSLL